MRSWLILVAVVLAACAAGKDDGNGGGTIDAPTGGVIDAPTGGTIDAPTGGTIDAPTGGEPDAAAGGLDPDLDPADPGGAVCTNVGTQDSCGLTYVCRFFDQTEGRCETCSPCGNLNASCSASDECDILFMCYQGRCTNFCTLGTSECGAPTDCIDIGHPTRGVCRPF